MVFENMLTMQGMMFFFVIVGFIVRKRGIVGTTGRLNMVDLCLYVLLPFNIFHAFLVQPHHDVWKPVVMTVLLSVLYNMISVASAFLLYKKTDEEKRKPLRYGTIVSNGGFLGNPVIESIYGTSGLLYASVFMLPVRIVMWSVGVSCFSAGAEKERAEKGRYPSLHCFNLSGTDRHVSPDFLAGLFHPGRGGIEQRQYADEHDADRNDACGDGSERTDRWHHGLLYSSPARIDSGSGICRDSSSSGGSGAAGDYRNHGRNAGACYYGTSVVQVSWR